MARIDNEYDAGGNVRRTKARHGNLDTNGAVLTGTTTDDHWYKYDAQNRFVTTKGSLIGGTIERGTSGIDLTYDAAGQRKTATQTATLQTTAPGGRDGPRIVAYQGRRVEEYKYDAAGFMTRVELSTEGAIGDGNGGRVASGTMQAAVLRGQYDRDLMGRIPAATEYGDGGQAVQQRGTIAYEHGSSRVVSDRVQRWQFGSGGLIDQGTTLSYYLYDGLDQLKLLYADSYTPGQAIGIATPAGPRTATEYSYTWRDPGSGSGAGGALADKTVFRPKAAGESPYSESKTTYDANGFVLQVATTGQNMRTIDYVTDIAGQVISRRQGANAPAVFSTYLAGLKLGEVSNDGTDNTDPSTGLGTGFATAVNAQATARGTGAFRNGATANACGPAAFMLDHLSTRPQERKAYR